MSLVLLIVVLIAIYFWAKCGRDGWLPYAGLSPVWPPRSYPGWRPFPYWRDYIGRSAAEVKKLFDSRYPLSNVIYVNPIEQDIKMIAERGNNSPKKVIMVVVIGDEVRDIQTNFVCDAHCALGTTGVSQ